MATSDQVLAAQQAGAAAAAEAQRVADRANPRSFTDYVFGGALVDDVLDDGLQLARDAASAIVPGAAAAAETANTVLNVIKWIGITALIIVGLLAVLWLLVAFFGLRWAAGLLSAIVPALAKNAKIVAHI